jgi:quinol-cytochrome oxidoreductase complex cytochrome b subunit
VAIVVARRGCHRLMLAIDAKFWGVVVMGGAVIILFFLPWLDNSPVKSIRYRPTGTSTCTASLSSTSCAGLPGHQAALGGHG